MPTKFKSSMTDRDRSTGKTKTVHHYMKTQSVSDLKEALESSNTQPKLKQKIRNELVRRKVV
jgi:hypothetical protein